MGNSVVGKKLRWYEPDGLMFEPVMVGTDTIEYTVVKGDRAPRHAIQKMLYYRIAPGIEATGWYEESGAIVHIIWFWESQTTQRFAAAPAWLVKDFSVSSGDNQDPEFVKKIRKLADEGPDYPRRVRTDMGYFEII